MLVIKLPATVPAVLNNDGAILEAELCAATSIREAVLSLPFWKQGAELRRIEACLQIEDALDANPLQPRLTVEARNLLRDAMELRMPNGNHGTINVPRANRYFMRIFRAVVVAEEEKKLTEPGEEKTEALS